MTARRIAYIVKWFPKLSEVFIGQELAEFRRRGVEILVLSLAEPEETLRHRFIADHGLDRLTVYGAANFRAALGEFQPDLIHAHFATNPAASARALAAEIGVPFTFTSTFTRRRRATLPSEQPRQPPWSPFRRRTRATSRPALAFRVSAFA